MQLPWHNPFEEKVIWLTGASSGIGYELASALAARKAKVVVSSRTEAPLLELQQRYTKHIFPLPLDVTHHQAVMAASKYLADKFGHVDIIILNAGTLQAFSIDEFNIDIFKENFSVNFFGAVSCIQSALPLLVQSKNPYIVGVASAGAYVGLPKFESYGASKAALRYLLQSLQVSLSPYKIDVSIVCPGFVQTPMLDQVPYHKEQIVSVEKAVNKIIAGMKWRTSEIRFPFRTAFAARLAMILPDRLRISLTRGLLEKR